MSASNNYRHVYTQLVIDATPAEIWAVLTDFARFPQWNGFIKSISGPIEVGGYLKVTLQPEGESAMSFSPKVVHAVPNSHLAWRGKVLIDGLFDGTHSFRLVPQESGGTMLIHEERFSGLLVPLFKRMLQGLPETFSRFNHSLATEVGRGKSPLSDYQSKGS